MTPTDTGAAAAARPPEPQARPGPAAGGEQEDAFARSLAFPPGQGRVLATVTDQDGRRHRLRYLHPLVADCCELTEPRLVCELIAGEGEEQARAAARAYADQLRAGTLLGPPGDAGRTRALSRRAGVVPA